MPAIFANSLLSALFDFEADFDAVLEAAVPDDFFLVT
jgi:hypothetical protein